MTTTPFMDGVFAIDKPKGMSSAQVIRDWQGIFNSSAYFAPALERETRIRGQESNSARKRRRRNKIPVRVKMGHGGTLDPLASGVLIIGVERGTKALEQFLWCKKTYETVVVFGASSDSYDRMGKLLKMAPYEHITRDAVAEALDTFLGTTKQTPPLFSALKMNGKPLYEYAREGLPIPRDIPTRDVTVDSIELVEWYEPGTHRHFWPREQASEADKRAAQQVEQAIHGIGNADYCQSDKEGIKRKPESPSPDDKVYETSHKRPKVQSSPLMSGALPSSSEDTPINPSHLENMADAELPETASSHSQQPLAHAGREPGLVTIEVSAPDPAQEDPVISPHDSSTTPTPKVTIPKGKGSDLVQEEDPNAPPPWGAKIAGPPAARIRMTVSSGFYVRCLCHDLGEKVGSAALMAELVRSRQSHFVLGENVLAYDEITNDENTGWGPKVAGALRDWNLRQEESRRQGGIEIESELW